MDNGCQYWHGWPTDEVTVTSVMGPRGWGLEGVWGGGEGGLDRLLKFE